MSNKTLLSILLIVCMIFSLMPTIFAEQTVEEIMQSESYVEEFTELVTEEPEVLIASSDCDGHEYEEAEVVEPTCKSMGYTVYKCINCGDEHIEDYIDMLQHDYTAFKILPTCQKLGYWEHTCKHCGKYYISSYLDKIPHEYDSEVTNPTCKDMGYTTYICRNCYDTYKSDYTDKLPHEYDVTIIEPTCTSMGFWIYDCKTCSYSYENYYRDELPHNYRKSVVVPTCFSMGYTNYTCTDCGYSYKDDYKLPVEHGYVRTVIPPTCTEYGYTMYNCPDCYESYISDYVSEKGHNPSNWIVDVFATIENSGRQHIECTVCKEVLQETAIEQLLGKDYSDEDGRAHVGDYSIVLTDEKGKPVSNSEVTIDVNDRISVNLPDGKLLDYAKPIIISAFLTETQRPMEGIDISIVDCAGNTAIVATNVSGQIVLPSNESKAEDGKATIGVDYNGEKKTFVVTITDNVNVVVPNFNIYVDENNCIVAELSDGTIPTRENPVMISLADQEGNAHGGVSVMIKGDDGTVEEGITDVYGNLTLPVATNGYTDENGKIIINELSVILSDETGVIPDAYISYNEDGIIHINLPEGKNISYSDRITVTVVDSVGNPVANKCIVMKDTIGNEYTNKTSENSSAMIPPTNIDYTDVNGYAEVSGFMIILQRETGVIEDAFVELDENNSVKITLPEGMEINDTEKIAVIVTNKSDGTPVEGISVTVKEMTTDKEIVSVTGADGKSSIAEDDGQNDAAIKYNVTVEDTHEIISAALIEIEDEKIYVTLPDTHKLTKSNQTTVTVTDKENVAVKGVSVTVNDYTGESITKSTNAKGQITVPVKTSSNRKSSSNTKTVDEKIKPIESKIQKAYMQGYPDGEFKPDGNMTRAEATAIFARLISEEKGEKISGKAGFDDIPESAWYAGYVGYLAKYDIVKGYEDNTFRPEKLVTRAEFITMTVRYYALFNVTSDYLGKTKYTDMDKNHWAYSSVCFANEKNWLCYEGDELKPDVLITRAEVVSMINKATNRVVDKEYIDKNIETLNVFTDLENSTHWALYDILSATNNINI